MAVTTTLAHLSTFLGVPTHHNYLIITNHIIYVERGINSCCLRWKTLHNLQLKLEKWSKIGLCSVTVAYRNINLALLEKNSEGVSQNQYIPCIIIYVTMLRLMVKLIGMVANNLQRPTNIIVSSRQHDTWNGIVFCFFV